MIYIKLSTLEFPRHEGDILIEHPELDKSLTGDSFICPNTYAKVTIKDVPEHDQNTQFIRWQTPQLINGVWTVGYDVVDYSQEQIAQFKTRMIQPQLNKKGQPPNVIA
jgi:hypothetical protein